jgi:hypothetical protein
MRRLFGVRLVRNLRQRRLLGVRRMEFQRAAAVWRRRSLPVPRSGPVTVRGTYVPW